MTSDLKPIKRCPTAPDRAARGVLLLGTIVLLAWPGEPPRSASYTLAAVLFGLWVWGRLILKPWRPDPK